MLLFILISTKETMIQNLVENAIVCLGGSRK